MKTVATCPKCKGQHWTIYEDSINCGECGWEYRFMTGDEEPYAAPQLASELVNAVNQSE